AGSRVRRALANIVSHAGVPWLRRDNPVPRQSFPQSALHVISNVRTLLLPLVHLLGLWGFGVAQPLYDILRKNGDFFVAHRAGPVELVTFVAVVSLGLPLILALPWIVAALVRPRVGRVILIGLVALL